MDHHIAESTAAADRYLLNEMPEEERADFEAHYFDCRNCADKVRAGAVFIDNSRHIFGQSPRQHERAPSPKPGFRWFRLPVLVPSFASLCLLAVVGYQNLITMPALRAPQILSTEVIAPLTRGEAAPVVIDPDKPLFNLNFAVDAPRVYPSYACEFRNAQRSRVLLLHSASHDVSSFTLSFLLPASRFPDGAYELILRPAGEPQTIVQRYTFAIRRGHPDDNSTRE